MDPFEITLSGESYAIQPLVSANFEVYRFRELIGFLTPTVGSSGTLWGSREIDPSLAVQIGSKIQALGK